MLKSNKFQSVDDIVAAGLSQLTTNEEIDCKQYQQSISDITREATSANTTLPSQPSQHYDNIRSATQANRNATTIASDSLSHLEFYVSAQRMMEIITAIKQLQEQAALQLQQQSELRNEVKYLQQILVEERHMRTQSQREFFNSIIQQQDACLRQLDLLVASLQQEHHTKQHEEPRDNNNPKQHQSQVQAPALHAYQEQGQDQHQHQHQAPDEVIATMYPTQPNSEASNCNIPDILFREEFLAEEYYHSLNSNSDSEAEADMFVGDYLLSHKSSKSCRPLAKKSKIES